MSPIVKLQIIALCLAVSAGARGFGDELGRFNSGRGERLFADDVLAGRQRLPALREVQPIGRCQVNHVDRRVCQQFLVRAVTPRQAQGRRGRRAA